MDTRYLNIISGILLVIIIFSIYNILSYIWQRNRRIILPPGPFAFPLIGTICSHGFKLDPENLTDMSKRYGDVFMISMGPQKFIILNSYESIQSAMRRPNDFAHRGNDGKYTWMHLNPQMCGIIARNYDETFIANRAMAMGILRQLGIGRHTMQGKILTEAYDVIDMIRCKNKTPFCPSVMIETSVANVILDILINKRYPHGDTKVMFIQKQTHQFIDNVMWTFAVDSFPGLRHIQPFKGGYINVTTAYNNIITFMWGHALELIDRYKHGHSTSFVEIFAEKNFPGDVARAKESLELRYMLQDFLVAGLETTSTILQWIIVYLTNRTEIQHKLRTQTLGMVGSERKVVLADRPRLPYLDAVIQETLRFSNLTPLMMHMSNLTRDVQLGKFTIPKRSMVMLNYHSVNMNPEVWGDPEVFRPERHLAAAKVAGKAGDQLSRTYRHFPFGTGGRTCTGELLAKQELFLFTASLFQNFVFELPEGVSEISEEPIREFTWRPKPFLVKAVPLV